HEIMSLPGVRNPCVKGVTLEKSQESYELRPQGGRRLVARQSLNWERCRVPGERDRGDGELPQRRGHSCGAVALDQGAANRSREIGLHGRLPRPEKVAAVDGHSPARFSGILAGMALAMLATACSSHKQAPVDLPPPPAIQQPAAIPSTSADASAENRHPSRPKPPLYVETGMASWYGAPYNKRRSSDGKIYNMNAMTAAHRTLPLGTVVRVTNTMTGRSAVVRITDRGPFVKGRIVDLSLAAAKATDVWRPGTALVKLQVLEAPAPLDMGGRWAVQI